MVSETKSLATKDSKKLEIKEVRNQREHEFFEFFVFI